MIINEKTRESLPIDWDSYYVVADFDRTITNGSSKTSWSILASSDLVPETYKDERNAYYDHYRPIEIDETIDKDEKNALMKEWFQKHIELFVKYKLEERIFNEAATNLRIMEFRKGAKEFIDFLHEKNIPLIIISAGIGNFVECFLKNNGCFYDNVHVISNKIIFKDGIACGVDENIIHSFNKNEVSIPSDIKEELKNRPNVLLLGDQPSDLNMVDPKNHNTVITTCFMNTETSPLIENYKDLFDILIEENEDYDNLSDALNSGIN